MKSPTKNNKTTASDRNRKGHALWIRVLALILAITMVLGVLVAGAGALGF